MLWFGDIVSLYAVAATPLYFMRDYSLRRLAATAIACLVAPAGSAAPARQNAYCAG